MSSIFDHDPERCPANPDGVSFEDWSPQSEGLCLCLMTLMARGVWSLAQRWAMRCWYFACFNDGNRNHADVRAALTRRPRAHSWTYELYEHPSAAGSQPLEPLSRQTFGTFEWNAGLQMGRKTLKYCRCLAMTRKFPPRACRVRIRVALAAERS